MTHGQLAKYRAEGYRAHQAGLGRDACPYPTHSHPEWVEWMNGWEYAAMAKLNRNEETTK